MSTTIEVRVEWLDAPGVSTPELAATWARYELWIGNRCVTQVEDADGTFRRSVYASLYPLAEWIAANWWSLVAHIRPSAVEARYWTWSNVPSHPWLRWHNLRGAGDGMAWPNLTLVPEGPVTHIAWAQDIGEQLTPIRFASSGNVPVRADDVREGLAKIVDHVLDRLAENGLTKTRLAEEWAAVGNADDEEREFCQTVARLGLDPYSVSDQTAADVIRVADSLPDELAADFFDSVDPATLVQAAEWTRQAVHDASEASAQANESLSLLYQAVSPKTDELVAGIERPWTTGYAMARRTRREVKLSDVARFDTSPWVGVHDTHTPFGIQAIAAINHQRCGLAMSGGVLGRPTGTFWQARALGRALVRPDQRSFALSPARGHDERVARAFAAELLAPASGIRSLLKDAGEDDDAALEAVASHYHVSPLVVRHQYENQLATTSDRYT
jgi:hypothetical protein